ncbi:MAG: CU044_2847 family protein [Candidatus Omnitrophota bacterium]
MKQLVEFPSSNNDSILIEIEVPDEGGAFEVSRGGAIVRATKSFEFAMDAITPIADCLIGRLKNSECKPKEIEVEFGVKINVDAKIIITSSSLEANFKVTLKWKQE